MADQVDPGSLAIGLGAALARAARLCAELPDPGAAQAARAIDQASRLLGTAPPVRAPRLVRTAVQALERSEPAFVGLEAQASARLAARLRDLDGAIGDLAADERRVALLQGTLPTAIQLAADLVRQGREVMRALGEAGSAAVAELAGGSLSPARPGSAQARVAARTGRHRVRVFVDRQEGLTWAGWFAEPVARKVDAAAQQASVRITRHRQAMLATVAAADDAIARLPDPGRVGLGRPRPGPLPRYPLGSVPVGAPARVLRKAAEHAVRSLRRGDGPASGRLLLGHSVLGDLPAVWRPAAHVVDREAVCEGLAGAWRRYLAEATDGLVAQLSAEFDSDLAPHVADGHAFLAAFVDALATTRKQAEAERHAVLRQAAELAECAEELAELRRVLVRLTRRGRGGVSVVAGWGLAELAARIEDRAGPAGAAARPPVGAVVADLRAVAEGRGELRVPVVAPTKAGKSTLINAIVGADLLPAWSLATTCLPTRVIPIAAAGARAEPEFRIGGDQAEAVRGVWARLRGELGDQARAADLRARMPQLAGPIDRLRRGEAHRVPGACAGAAAVHDALDELHQLVRLAIVLLAEDELPEALLEPPEVLAPCRWLRQPAPPARLVLVDTPGLDEPHARSVLGGVVARELQRAGAIILLLDFTRLDSSASAAVRELVDAANGQLEPLALHVVVNRADQRRYRDLDPAELRSWVQSTIWPGRSVPGRQIVETAADQALVAARFLAAAEDGLGARRREEAPVRDAIDDRAVVALLRLLFPDDWAEAAGRLTLAALLTAGRRAYERSGVPAFIDDTVAVLHRDAALLAVRAALRRLDHLLPGLTRDTLAEELADLGWALGEPVGPEAVEMAAP